MKSRKIDMMSMASAKSARSTKSAPGDIQLEDHLNMACKKYQCPFTVTVKKEFQCDTFSNVKNKTTMAHVTEDNRKEDLNHGGETSSSKSSSEDEDTIHITAIYDKTNNLVEIRLNNVKDIPRIVIKSICLIIPFYEHFDKISIKNSCLNPYTIHEINQILPISSITDLCFDGSPFEAANFSILLETKTSLRNLSLSRCSINDDLCKLIASKLHFLAPAESCLKALNLSSNHITNDGAKHISEALRSNRNLRYLNLADNDIDDIGAAYIFDCLKDFPMTSEEIANKRQRHVEYVKLKLDVYSKYLQKITTTGIDAISRKPVKKKTSTSSLKKKSHGDGNAKVRNDCLSTKAELCAADVMGNFCDPFSSDNIKIQSDYTYCGGNMELSYLNLSYNNLSYLSIKKLQDILIYQSGINKSYQTGLIRVMIEGNDVPVKCNEMNTISNLLEKSIVSRVQFNKCKQTTKRMTKGHKSPIET